MFLKLKIVYDMLLYGMYCYVLVLLNSIFNFYTLKMTENNKNQKQNVSFMYNIVYIKGKCNERCDEWVSWVRWLRQNPIHRHLSNACMNVCLSTTFWPLQQSMTALLGTQTVKYANYNGERHSNWLILWMKRMKHCFSSQTKKLISMCKTTLM